MSVSLLLITHPNIGQSLLAAAKITFGHLPLNAEVAEIGYQEDPDLLLSQLEKKIIEIDEGDGVLILSDLFGSTPCNIARKLQNNQQSFLVAGLNLPMLIRTMNYPTLSLLELAQKALSGGKDGIISHAKETAYHNQ